VSIICALCALLVGAVLLTSGIAKIGESRVTRRAMDDLGVPARLRNEVVAQALPVVEILLAAGILLAPSGWHRVPAALSVVLMALFAVLLARVVRQRRVVTCNCFGTLGGGAVDRTAVARNGALALAALICAVGARSFFASVDGATTLSWLGPVLAVLALAAAVLLRLRAAHARRGVVRTLQLTDYEGRTLAFEELVDPPTFLVFMTPTCGACSSLVPYLRTWPTAYGEFIDIQPVLIGTPEDFAGREPFEPLVEYVLYDRDKVVSETLEVRSYPSGVLLTPQEPLGGEPMPGYGPMYVALERLAKEHASS